MLRAIRLRGFKAFRDSGPIDIRPLTVLAGANSGGKSTIIQSLLLLKQSVGLSSVGVADDLILDGRYVQTDRISTIAFGQPPANQARIGIDLTIETRIPSNSVPRYFPNLSETPSVGDHGKLEDHRLTSKLAVDFAERRDRRGYVKVAATAFELTSEIHEVEGPRLRIDYVAGRYVPRMTGSGLDRPSLAGRKISGIAGVGFIPSHLALERDSKRTGGGPDIQPLPAIFASPLQDLRNDLTEHLKYLGPLREQPRRAYLHSGSGRVELGDRGENAAQILWLDRSRMVRYPSGSPFDSEEREVPLLDAVNRAFESLGIEQPLTVNSVRSVLYQINLGLRGNPSKRATISEVGFGVSQLLPIVLLALRSTPRDLLLFEQPEIHLHPRLQANLADFLVLVASSGRRVIVETHSDHLINRLRRRAAEDEAGRLQDLVSILFVRAGAPGAGALVEPLTVDQYGGIANWPPDFLPEASLEAEAIVKAAVAKRLRAAG